MTHTLHRFGSHEEISHDYVILAIPARGFNREGAAPKLKKILEIYLKYNPINFGCGSANHFNAQYPEMTDGIRDAGAVHAVFDKEENLLACLKELKEKDIGLSIVVSGLFGDVDECCQTIGLKRHTVNTSVGIFGKRELLPEEDVLKIHTMCGHAMISFNLIKHMVNEIKAGRTTARQAAEKMAANCHCGIFNPDRATAILEKLCTDSIEADSGKMVAQ